MRRGSSTSRLRLSSICRRGWGCHLAALARSSTVRCYPVRPTTRSRPARPPVSRSSAGQVRDEMSMFRLLDPFLNPLLPALDETGLLARVEAVAPGRGEEANDLYREEREARGEDVSPTSLWTAIFTDRDFRMPAMHFTALQ